MVFQRSMLNWRGSIYSIRNLFGIMVLQRSMLNWRGGGVNPPWVYMHCATYETYLDKCQDNPKIQCSGVP